MSSKYNIQDMISYVSRNYTFGAKITLTLNYIDLTLKSVLLAKLRHISQLRHKYLKILNTVKPQISDQLILGPPNVGRLTIFNLRWSEIRRFTVDKI